MRISQTGLRVTTAALLSFGVACSDSTGPNDSPVGTYSLVSVGGIAVPAGYPPDSPEILMLSGTLVISEGGTCSWAATADLGDGPTTNEGTCTWTLASSIITFVGQVPSPSTWSGDTISGDDENDVRWVWQR